MLSMITKISRNRLAAFGAGLLLAIAVLTLITPFLGMADPNVIDTANRFKLPLAEGYLLGTDHLGRDILSRLLWGTRLSLGVGLTAALIAAFFGSLVGILAGFYQGHTDTFLMRSIDVLMAFPYVLLALAIVAVLGPGLVNALIAVSIVNIPFFARNVRGASLAIAQSDYIAAARLSGRTTLSLLVFEILPNLASVIIVAFSTTMGWMILETAGLSFLGLGSQPPQSDLGSMLGEGRAALITHPHTSVIPGIMIFLIVMGVNLLGDGVRDALDPRLARGVLQSARPMTKLDRVEKAPVITSYNLLEVTGLNTEFRLGNKTLKAVQDVSFVIEPGECLAMVGESGSGKSVTALSLTGLAASPPAVITAGRVGFQGEDILELSYEQLRNLRGRRISYVFQDPTSSLHPLHTIGDQLIEAMMVHEGSLTYEQMEQQAIKCLYSVRISDPPRVMKAFPHELSGGMRQRVGISMALINDPDLIIADEPTTALDVTVQAQILGIFRHLRKEQGLAVMFISHDINVIAQISDRIAVMYAGQIVEAGPTDQVLANPLHPYTQALLACSPQIGSGRGLPEAIKGSPPALDNLPMGCAFAPRCSQAIASCHQSQIRPKQEASRMVRCLKVELTNG